MTQEQQDHIDSLTETFATLAESKYTKGVQEHGGNLWDVPEDQLLDYAIEEAIDQVVYLLTLKQKRS